jgi:type II secretory ATPase GspE/PulE/Tfp pilus assembly ATPase PilB-like protein
MSLVGLSMPLQDVAGGWFHSLVLAEVAQSQSFRGEGLYFNLFALAGFLAIFLIWIRSCWWLADDVDHVNLSSALWNHVLLGCGVLGLLLFWMIPAALGAFFFLVGLGIGPLLVYVYVFRNPLVKPVDRVLTPAHIRRVVMSILRRKGKVEEAKALPGVPVRFIGKSSATMKENKARIARVEASPGYRAALEMVYRAVQARATDIHLEPTKSEMVVRYRVDGILQTMEPMTRQLGDSVLNIIKVVAELDITEKRKPQDGSFSAQVEDRVVDFRVATAGAVIGEKLVMRILDKTKQLISFEKLGMRESMRGIIHKVSTAPHGMLVVCGPTGAGKSTTLYACLNDIDRTQLNVITLENPVEYQIDHTTQIEINPKAGKTFAGELRSVLRQDPDVILVGEIRDKETAESACQAAQTGHMVFTTVHANDTVTAIARLIDLGVPPFLVSNAVSAVLGQRLVRMLCPRCKVAYKPNPEMLKRANLPVDKIKHFHRPPEPGETKGKCKRCGGTGYFGRTGVFELMVLTDPIRELIRESPNLNAIRQEAVKNGMTSLQEDGLRQVIEGTTSIQELLRVCK